MTIHVYDCKRDAENKPLTNGQKHTIHEQSPIVQKDSLTVGDFKQVTTRVLPYQKVQVLIHNEQYGSVMQFKPELHCNGKLIDDIHGQATLSSADEDYELDALESYSAGETCSLKLIGLDGAPRLIFTFEV